ncbi:maltase A1 isoform X2 [Agrilus planipennis]|nr:maltase A1 isoform X2 [Agrilus planipennis]
MLPGEEKNASEKSNVNANEIKFTANEKQNGDAKLDIGDVKGQYVGMSKEELMKYANDPFWVRLRWFLFISFWILWAAMLVGAIMIIVAAPKCNPPEPRTWWEQGPLTEVKEEVTKQQLQALKDNGVQGIILSWFSFLDAYSFLNQSTDYLKVVKAANELNVSVIIDLNPLSSTKWFRDSEGKDDFYTDYYIWQKPKGVNATGSPEPPNNWISKENRSSWVYSEVRKEFYYAPQSAPHLNFRNPNVIREFTNVLVGLIDKGARGIRLHGAPYLLVDLNFADEAIIAPEGFYHTEYGFYSHTKTENLHEIGPIIKQWRDVIRNKTENGAPLILAEDLNTLEPFKVNGSLIIDLPRHSKLFNSSRKLSSSLLHNDLKSTFTLLEHNWPLWEQNNNALPSDVMYTLISLLPGVPLLHNNETLDPELLKIRSSPSVQYGTFLKYQLNNGTVFAYTRVSPGNPGYLVAINPTDRKMVVDFPKEVRTISQEITVQYISKNYNETGVTPELKIDAKMVPISPEAAGVFTYIPQKP